ncbi:hypothetical protein [Candidatus Synechococcus spongiarum]|uniref:Uncharacterized protein n=1 Tax=Candidatus Synechococcus spongiarum TaxID=431041 RepID=A0A171DGX2_9SYNE|nr:hypothetical protein [Candidatus Synechococcus spongiarum]SAY39009.1 hypothetical protein FLM9_1056 [Candidatus Synechococcus spongiarum]
MINRQSPVGLGPVVWLLGLLCIGCSGTPLGDQLTERLSEPDDPVEETAVPTGAAVNTPTGEQLTEQPSEPGDPVEDSSPANPTATNPAAATSQAPALVTTTPPLNPTPYRLLLRLPAADPAAPAEAVTQALRAAGILFEVETIERLPNEPTPLAPSP